MTSDGGRGRTRKARRPAGREGRYAAAIISKFVRCGKPGCRICAKGPGHGPYLYRQYRDSQGHVRTEYIGPKES